MIYPSLNTIADQLNSHIFEKWGETINGTGEIVELNNIADINENQNDLQNKIILTLINIQEEPTLKNGPFYTRKSGEKLNKHHPAVYMNLFVLISITKKEYREALQLLSDTITFFQSHKVFSGTITTNGMGSSDGESFRIVAEQCNFSFQEIFDMWSNLGNKQLPSTIYKLRLLKFLDSQIKEDMPVVKSVKVDSNGID